MTDPQDARLPAGYHGYPLDGRPDGAPRRADRPAPGRSPRLRPAIGRTGPRARRFGPRPGPDGRPAPGRPALLAARSLIVLAVVVGQLWALTVATNAWMIGDTDTAWWTTAFSIGSFLAVLLVWWRAPRGDR
ncbi:hypothetical protein ACFZB9_26425 [Kitasatospora sp. NPDC008050]|uniref:hypothetical protein n=1 Tax=Kitasatospora sp. NPDC008050 TaxID=3364021 RepID=UPI0036E514C0